MRLSLKGCVMHCMYRKQTSRLRDSPSFLAVFFVVLFLFIDKLMKYSVKTIQNTFIELIIVLKLDKREKKKVRCCSRILCLFLLLLSLIYEWQQLILYLIFFSLYFFFIFNAKFSNGIISIWHRVENDVEDGKKYGQFHSSVWFHFVSIIR